MKTKLLLFFAFITLGLTAQTTYNLGWSTDGGSNGQQLSIEVGDTVIWTWGADGMSHNLAQIDDISEPDFADTYFSEGHVYSHTFTTPGTHDYLCSPHPNTMNGIITVSEALGIDDVVVSEFTFFPNPVNNVLSIKAQASIDGITIFNMLGQAVVRSTPNTTDSTVDMSALQTGAYFVQVSINNTLKTVRVIKN